MHKQQPWLKKVDTKFDVPMGSYDGAETCELVGSLSSFPNYKTSTSTSDFTETTDWPFQTPRPEKQTTENIPRFFSTRRRKKLFRDGRGIFNHRRTISYNASSKKSSNFYSECTGKLTYSSTLIRPLQRHIRLQVYQEPPSDRLVKGIWRWHAKDDIYKTF